MNVVVRLTGAGREILILVIPRYGEEEEGRALGRLIEHFRYTDDPGDPDDDVLYASVAPAISDALDHLGPLAADAAISRLAGIPVYRDETVPPGIVELRRRGETIGVIRLQTPDENDHPRTPRRHHMQQTLTPSPNPETPIVTHKTSDR